MDHRRGGTAAMDVPGFIDLGFRRDDAHVELEMPTRYAGEEWLLLVTQGGETVFDGPSARVTELFRAGF